MKKVILAIFAVLLICSITACGGSNETDAPETDVPETDAPSIPMDIIGLGYKIVYDASDSVSISAMAEFAQKINTAIGVKPASTNSQNPESQYEIQFNLKSGRAEAEQVYGELLSYSAENRGVFIIKSLGDKIVICGSDVNALRLASDSFVALANNGTITVDSNYSFVGAYKLDDYAKGIYTPIDTKEFLGNCDITSIALGGNIIMTDSGVHERYIATNGKSITKEAIEVITAEKSASVQVEINDMTAKVTVTGGDKKTSKVYTLHFIETAPIDKYEVNTATIPYWQGNIVYNESLTFYGDEAAPLLYTPEHVLSVRSFDLKTQYKEGVDYVIKDGKIALTENSSIPCISMDEFYHDIKTSNSFNAKYSVTGHSYIIFGEGTFFHQKQVFVTYTHKGEWSGFVPSTTLKLNNFIANAKAGKAQNIVFFGDSITAGANASKRGNCAPYTETWPEMVTNYLRGKFPGSTFNYVNTAVGGKDTVWGIDTFEENVISKKPDLLIIGFGMNDGGKSPETFTANIKNMVDRAIAANPKCEILLIGTMLPHDKTTYYGGQYLFESALYKLAENYSNVDVVPMTSVHTSLLEHKRYTDMAGNNVNHPNDFLIRVYAQTIIKVLGA